MGSIKIDGLADAIVTELEAYNKEITESVDAAVDRVAKDAVSDLQFISPKKTGKYSKGWRRKKYKHKQVIYNAKKPYATAPLEFGHASRNGGRVKAIPHIKDCEKTANEQLENLCVEIVSGGLRL